MTQDNTQEPTAQEIDVPDWRAIRAELQKPLSVAAIKPPPRGKFGEYVDGLHVIREANRIFGENGWSYEITRLEQAHGKVFDIGDKRQFRVTFLCTVRVNVHGVIREGAAAGSGVGKEADTSAVIESAVKEAETDALKRALRGFGNTFGLALYEKDKSKREVYDPRDKHAVNQNAEPDHASDAQAKEAAASRLLVSSTISEIGAIKDITELQGYWKTLNANFHQVAGMPLVIEAKDRCKAKIDAALDDEIPY